MYAIRESLTMSFPNATDVVLWVVNYAIRFALNSSGFVMSEAGPTVQISPGEMN